MQLQPHFLFNTLNTIAEMVHDDPDKADTMITGLSDLLRRALDLGTAQEIPLADELDLLARYLDIQQARFGDRLQRHLSTSPTRRGDARVPVLLLQPLVENAIRHGLAGARRRRAASTSTRTARRRPRSRSRSATTAGRRGRAPAGRERIGLGNTRARLEALYGGGHRLDLTNAPTARRTRDARDAAAPTADRRMTLRALVVDDEARGAPAHPPPARRASRDVTVVGECGDGASAVEAIARERPDLVFLDVQMPELDGFGVREGRAARRPARGRLRDRVRPLRAARVRRSRHRLPAQAVHARALSHGAGRARENRMRDPWPR